MNIYLDNQAAKPVDERVISEMLPYFREKFANPASLHGDGDLATDILEKSRNKVAEFVNTPDVSNIIFTCISIFRSWFWRIIFNKRKG